METLPGGLTLELCSGAFPLSTDSIALASFVRLPPDARVLDLGSGCATLGMLLCATDSRCRVTGVEIMEADHQAALENIRRNRLEHRLESICADLRHLALPPGGYDCCVSNPPYFVGGPASKTAPQARREDLCSLEALFSAASKALKFGGDFYLVHKPQRLGQICGCATAVSLEPKRLCLVRHRSDGPVSLVLLQCRKGAKPGLAWEEWSLHDSLGHPTEQFRKLYHL